MTFQGIILLLNQLNSFPSLLELISLAPFLLLGKEIEIAVLVSSASWQSDVCTTITDI